MNNSPTGNAMQGSVKMKVKSYALDDYAAQPP